MSPESLDARLRELLELLGMGYESVGNGALRVDAGSTAVYLSAERARDRSVIMLMAPVLSGVAPDPPALVQLLALHAEIPFAKFSWHPDQQLISVDYELLADYLDPEELRVAVEAVGGVADAYDEQLQNVLGGRRPLAE